MAELAVDVVEQILVRLDVKDLIRCKSVCKSWRSFISGPRFVKAHLNHAYKRDRDNHQLGHTRLSSRGRRGTINEDSSLYCNFYHIVGSYNGLVCISPEDVELLVTNPSTREQKKLPTPPFRPHMHRIAMIRQVLCWGFGYDSSADDYKVIVGFMKNFDSKRTRFYALTLKSNTWKLIGQVKYSTYVGKTGILCGGALHWFMKGKSDKKVIISLDLSTEEFKEIPQPDADLLYDCEYEDHRLGVIEGCLCIYSCCKPLSTKKWVMKNNKWELYIDNRCQSKYDVAYCFTNLYCMMGSQKLTSDVYTLGDGKRVPSNGADIRASIFVKSLVSPFFNSNDEGQKGNAKQGQEGNGRVDSGAKGCIRKRKRNKMRKGSCKHKKPLVWI